MSELERCVSATGAEASVGAVDLPMPAVPKRGENPAENEVLRPGDFQCDSIDIYTNTLCHGAGSEGDDRLCTYCFLTTEQLKNRNMMRLDDVDRIIRWATMDDESPISTVSLLGGEFALHPEAKTIVRRVYEAGLNIHLVTNGSAEFRNLIYDAEIADILRDPQRDNLVAVSMDSMLPEINDKYRGRGAAFNAMATIDWLSPSRLGIPFRVNATVMRRAIYDGRRNLLPRGGLERLYNYAQHKGAQSVLVHFPSTVGRGQLWSRAADLTIENARFRQELPDGGVRRDPYDADFGDWQQVLDTARNYNKTEKSYNPSFRVECEAGYDVVNHCELLERTSSLQFVSPRTPESSDIPVVACGLNMDRADQYSAYVFRAGQLYVRAGDTELRSVREAAQDPASGVLNSLSRRCPLQPGTGRACIYDRTGTFTRESK